MGDFLFFLFFNTSSLEKSAQSIISFCPHRLLWKTKMYPRSLFSYWTSLLELLPGVEIPEQNGSWDLASSLWPKPLFQIARFVSVLLKYDQAKRQSPTSLTAHTGMNLVQLQMETGSSVRTEGKMPCMSVTEPANEPYNTWPLGQTQVPSSDVGRFINNANEKEKKCSWRVLWWSEEKKELHCWLTGFTVRLERCE